MEAIKCTVQGKQQHSMAQSDQHLGLWSNGSQHSIEQYPVGLHILGRYGRSPGVIALAAVQRQSQRAARLAPDRLLFLAARRATGSPGDQSSWLAEPILPYAPPQSVGQPLAPPPSIAASTPAAATGLVSRRIAGLLSSAPGLFAAHVTVASRPSVSTPSAPAAENREPAPGSNQEAASAKKGEGPAGRLMAAPVASASLGHVVAGRSPAAAPTGTGAGVRMQRGWPAAQAPAADAYASNFAANEPQAALVVRRQASEDAGQGRFHVAPTATPRQELQADQGMQRNEAISAVPAPPAAVTRSQPAPAGGSRIAAIAVPPANWGAAILQRHMGGPAGQAADEGAATIAPAVVPPVQRAPAPGTPSVSGDGRQLPAGAARSSIAPATQPGGAAMSGATLFGRAIVQRQLGDPAHRLETGRNTATLRPAAILRSAEQESPAIHYSDSLVQPSAATPRSRPPTSVALPAAEASWRERELRTAGQRDAAGMPLIQRQRRDSRGPSDLDNGAGAAPSSRVAASAAERRAYCSTSAAVTSAGTSGAAVVQRHLNMTANQAGERISVAPVPAERGSPAAQAGGQLLNSPAPEAALMLQVSTPPVAAHAAPSTGVAASAPERLAYPSISNAVDSAGAPGTAMVQRHLKTTVHRIGERISTASVQAGQGSPAAQAGGQLLNSPVSQAAPARPLATSTAAAQGVLPLVDASRRVVSTNRPQRSPVTGQGVQRIQVDASTAITVPVRRATAAVHGTVEQKQHPVQHWLVSPVNRPQVATAAEAGAGQTEVQISTPSLHESGQPAVHHVLRQISPARGQPDALGAAIAQRNVDGLGSPVMREFLPAVQFERDSPPEVFTGLERVADAGTRVQVAAAGCSLFAFQSRLRSSIFTHGRRRQSCHTGTGRQCCSGFANGDSTCKPPARSTRITIACTCNNCIGCIIVAAGSAVGGRGRVAGWR